ncbi:hypothetical protein RVR_9580 [Actinacidiphila reveromycinica]|uniref:Uncharacterized protein n=1 Tax=Actinacidiphila reveromycinica TaxID=659352 RepID=A0A7U3VSL8_9ACTN|nr:hypothetical protein [Streptomyces sp. SN-593]BBB01939.1 hypothetical protein RVR_9580 [Streptomyces sp. SN-593]
MTEEHAAGPDPRHRPPEGLGDELVEALGTLSKALETVERARGRLYDFHQLMGGADLTLGKAVDQLRQAGARAEADALEREIVGRNVLPGMWTFQIVEVYDDSYYRPFSDLERQVRERLADGRRHLYEARMKEERRTPGHPDHTARP